MLQSVAMRKMLNGRKYGVSLQMGNACHLDNFMIQNHFKNNFSIVIGLYHNILRVGYFDYNDSYLREGYSLVEHPTESLMLVTTM